MKEGIKDLIVAIIGSIIIFIIMFIPIVLGGF